MRNWGLLLGFTILTANPASAVLVHYELTLTTDESYTAFGGGPGGDVITGLFGFDETLLSHSGPAWQPLLSDRAFYLTLDINGTRFSTTDAGAPLDNALIMGGGGVEDVFFNLTNPVGDVLLVSTAGGGSAETEWSATPTGPGTAPAGTARSTAVTFAPTTITPEPATWTLGVLAGLVLLRRRRTE